MKSVDYKLFFTVLILIIFWMIMISSVSVYSSFKVTNKLVQQWLIDEPYNHFYVKRNIISILASLAALWVVVKIPYTFFEKYAKYFLGITVVLLILVFFIWEDHNWARGWISIPWIPFEIQPTEFLKLTLVVYFAHFFKKYKSLVSDFYEWFLPFIFILWVLVVLIWAQPDFWAIMVIVPVSFIMFFIAGANVKHLSILVLLWFSLIGSVYTMWKYDKTNPDSKNKFSYITDRMDNFLADNKEIIERNRISEKRDDSNYQIEQALIAIWSGGFVGLGFGNSVQKFWYLPEVQGDFIFSVIVEELGFMGAFVLLSMYLYIWYRGFYISTHTSDLFAKYCAIWISSWILMQAFINIWVNLNIVPLTWITLPFVSYWGSSLLSLSLWLALLLNISRYTWNAQKDLRKLRQKRIFG